MYWIDQMLVPIVVNMVSPVLLFLFASLVLRNDTIAKYVSKIYQAVKDKLEMNAPDVANANEISKNVEKLDVSEKSSRVEESDILRKISKNYGSDMELGWDVRTFYTLTKNQVLDKKVINFKVKGNEFDIYVSTETLIKRFSLDTEDGQISDGSGRIRVYIYKKSGVDEYYLMRFGKGFLEEPIRLEVLENNA